MNFETKVFDLLNGVKLLAITCLQWGDTGKGKFVDAFAIWADIIARGTGGANAGHTIYLNGRKYVFHLIPSGILHDADGKINIIGSGVAFDPGIVWEELSLLDKEKMPYNNLLFSERAHLVLPQHLLLDRLRESKADKVGSTGRGICDVYTDHYGRIGLRLSDMLNKDVFYDKLKRNLRDKMRLLEHEDPQKIKAILSHEHLGSGRYWDEDYLVNTSAIVETYMGYGERFKDMIRNTDELLRKASGKKNVLGEGAQGNQLSIDRGSYPYVTSSDCSVHGLMKGIGLDMRHLGMHLGIVKAFYMTRVGDGPFPTEIGGNDSASWCGRQDSNKETELAEYGNCSINDIDPFLQGIGIRQKGDEFGATTGRCRRTGWLDLPLLRNSISHSGPDIILTKLDVLDGCEEIKICDSYTFLGRSIHVNGNRVLRTGDRIDTAITDSHVLSRCRPNYVSFPGWKGSASDKPAEMMRIVDYVAKAAGANPRILSVGADREQTIFLN